MIPIKRDRRDAGGSGAASNGADGSSNGSSGADGSSNGAYSTGYGVRKPAGSSRRRARLAPSVSVVIPTLNEAKNLPYVLGNLPPDVYEVVIVDGYSTDDTVEVARELYPHVRIVSQTRRGKGNALTCGFTACRGDVIVAIDADGSQDPQEIPRFVEALVSDADFVKGSRFMAGGGSADITLLRRSGNWLFTFLVNTLFHTRYTDLCYGYNAFWARNLAALELDCDGFEVETLMNIRAAKAGLRIAEVPSFEERRLHGTSNLHTFRDGWRVLMTIVRERRRTKPVMADRMMATVDSA